MSLESIRLQADDPDLFFVTVGKSEAEVLCDLADAMHEIVGQSAILMDGDAYIRDNSRSREALRKARAALARLDERGGKP